MRPTSRSALASLALASSLLASCGAPAPPASSSEDPSADPSSRSSAPPTADPSSAAGGRTCEEIAARFLATVRAGSGACTSAGDCGCYNPVAGELGCGGVSDAATIALLTALEADFHAASCPWPHQCPAWACAPRCIDGRCAQ